MEDYTTKYLKYKAKYVNLKNSLNKSMSGGGNKIQILLFKADWCGHCKTFKPTWEALSKQYNTKYEFITYDADKERDKFEKYKVDSFPTIKIKNGDDIIDYDGERSVEGLTALFNSL
uniref:Thioredoxin domain-containing protein n=1 Tax=viral metagenome TaxID=1070528 RepID=A0A6C0HW41_9ZZZZ